MASTGRDQLERQVPVAVIVGPATTMSVRDPTISGVAKMSHASIPGLLSSRSTCLTACLGRRPRAWAKDLPMSATPSDAPVITPSVAFARESTRLV